MLQNLVHCEENNKMIHQCSFLSKIQIVVTKKFGNECSTLPTEKIQFNIRVLLSHNKN